MSKIFIDVADDCGPIRLSDVFACLSYRSLGSLLTPGSSVRVSMSIHSELSFDAKNPFESNVE